MVNIYLIASCNVLPVVSLSHLLLITLDNKDVAFLTLLGVSYRFLAADDENQC